MPEGPNSKRRPLGVTGKAMRCTPRKNADNGKTNARHGVKIAAYVALVIGVAAAFWFLAGERVFSLFMAPPVPVKSVPQFPMKP